MGLSAFAAGGGMGGLSQMIPSFSSYNYFPYRDTDAILGAADDIKIQMQDATDNMKVIITPMKILIRDINSKVIAAALNAGLEAEYGNITAKSADAVVSPANSFGFLSGGVDATYRTYFGQPFEDKVQEVITRRPHGELLIGEAISVHTGNTRIPYLIVAPTMRIPKAITDPTDIVLATRAAIREAIDKGWKTIAMPGMGTGCGGVDPEVAIDAMITGINAAHGILRRPGSVSEAAQRKYTIGVYN